jgi:glycosyltransferase involved in cell wall biosynthesis
MKKMFLSVIIPAFNEEETIKKGVLKEVQDYLTEQNYSWEVLLVDDASTDKTLNLMQQFAKKNPNFKVLAESHRGKGGTIMAGTREAVGEIILFCDMDQATPLSELAKFLPKFEEGFEIVIASRSGREGAPLVRKMMAYGFVVLRTLILRLPFKDTQCGFKAFKKEVAEKIFARLEVFNQKKAVAGAAVTAGFDLEVLYLARKMGLKVAEVPVIWRHKETERINPLRDSWEGFKDLLRVRFNSLSGKYR